MLEGCQPRNKPGCLEAAEGPAQSNPNVRKGLSVLKIEMSPHFRTQIVEVAFADRKEFTTIFYGVILGKEIERQALLVR